MLLRSKESSIEILASKQLPIVVRHGKRRRNLIKMYRTYFLREIEQILMREVYYVKNVNVMQRLKVKFSLLLKTRWMNLKCWKLSTFSSLQNTLLCKQIYCRLKNAIDAKCHQKLSFFMAYKWLQRFSIISTRIEFFFNDPLWFNTKWDNATFVNKPKQMLLLITSMTWIVVLVDEKLFAYRFWPVSFFLH